MKNLFLTTAFLLSSFPLFMSAQTVKNPTTPIAPAPCPKIMGFIGSGTGFSGKTFNFGATYLNSKNQGISASFLTNNHKTKKLPTHINTLGNSEENLLKLNELKIVNISFVKLYATSSKYIRLGFESGLDLYNYNYNAFTYKNPGSESSVSSVGKYFITRKEVNAVGISLKMKIDLPLAKYAGIELAPGINFNKHTPLIGFQVKLNIGLVR